MPLQLKPSVEEIRSIYYHELKKFVSAPSAFKGLNGSNEVPIRCLDIEFLPPDYKIKK
jgi:hypothetical protein